MFVWAVPDNDFNQQENRKLLLGRTVLLYNNSEVRDSSSPLKMTHFVAVDFNFADKKTGSKEER